MKLLNVLGAAALSASLAACSTAGALGDVLGGVLNAPTNNNQQANGTIQGVDTRSQVVFIRQQDGSTVSVAYDSRTQVVYNNQNYAVTALESGDQVRARIITNGNNSNNYYTDLIEVTQSVTSNNGGNGGTYNGTNNGQVYSVSGNVRSVDTQNGVFTLSTQGNGYLTVSMPYNARSTDVTRFRNLRIGDWVQIKGVYLNETRVELRNFY